MKSARAPNPAWWRPGNSPSGWRRRSTATTTNAISTVEILKELIAGYPVSDADVARLSPLLHEHINMLGRYSFSVPEAVANGELRPLRDPAEG